MDAADGEGHGIVGVGALSLEQQHRLVKVQESVERVVGKVGPAAVAAFPFNGIGKAKRARHARPRLRRHLSGVKARHEMQRPGPVVMLGGVELLHEGLDAVKLLLPALKDQQVAPFELLTVLLQQPGHDQ